MVRRDGRLNWDAYGRYQAPPAPNAPSRPPLNNIFKSCNYIEKQSSNVYFSHHRCDFDVHKQVPNPVGAGFVELEYIALASYLEAFAYTQKQKAAEWNKKRNDAKLEEQAEIVDAIAQADAAQEEAKSSRIEAIEFKDPELESAAEAANAEAANAEVAEETAEEAAEAGAGKRKWNIFGRRKLLRQKAQKAAAAVPVKSVEINPNLDPTDKPYKVLVVGGSQAYFGFLAGRAFKALGLRAQVSIYEGDPRAFNDVVEQTRKDSKVPGAGDIRVVQEYVSAKPSSKNMVTDRQKIGETKHVTLKEVVTVTTTTGDALLDAIKGREEVIVMNIGDEKTHADIIKGMRRSLGKGAKVAGGISQPRVLFFKTTKVRTASTALAGLPFQTYIVAAPDGIADNAGAHKDFIRPVLLRVDGEYYADALDDVADEVEFLAMAVHTNDPFLAIAQREGMTMCDSECECKSFGLDMMTRVKPPVCRGKNMNRAKQEKRKHGVSPKQKLRDRMNALQGQNWDGERLEEDQSYVAGILDNIKNKFMGKPKTEEELLASGLKLGEDGQLDFAKTYDAKNPKKKGKKGK